MPPRSWTSIARLSPTSYARAELNFGFKISHVSCFAPWKIPLRDRVFGIRLKTFFWGTPLFGSLWLLVLWQ
ncbi:hypothetical protein IQ06DRAFT_299120 [Phaeosphaeriaceae sp. SRC1lsM3a]|nr:hypothetical protein IQ06DRAFT_299120 [Stagonospora sp. SRC1lsM3a]